MEGQILNTVLQSLLTEIGKAYGNLLPVSYYFFYTMATLSLVRLGLAYAIEPSGNILAMLLTRLFKMSLMLWLIANLPYLHELLLEGAIKLGAKAAGFNTQNLILNPSEIAEYGVKVIAPIRLWLYELSWSFKNIGGNIVNIIFGVIAIILILAAFYYLAYQSFMALVDFYFSSILAPVFLAFQLFEYTAWLAVGAIRSPLQHTVKLFTIVFILNIVEPWMASLITAKQQNLQQVTSLVFAAMILVGLAVKASSWAAGIFTGQTTASAGDLAATANMVLNAGTTSTNIINRAQQASTSLIKGGLTTGAAAVTGAELRGMNATGLNKFPQMAYGAVEGATFSLRSSLADSISKGVRQGYTATGGDLAQVTSQQRIASLFKAPTLGG